jgi:heme iron utilization protein
MEEKRVSEKKPIMGQKSGSPVLPLDDEGRMLAKHILATCRSGALGTLTEARTPYVSLVGVARGGAGFFYFLVSRLSLHTQHMLVRPNVSLLLSQSGKGDPLAHPRLSLWGSVEGITRESKKFAAARAAYLIDHPKAQLYVDFPDFLFFKMSVDGASLNGGFAKAYQLTSTEFRLVCIDTSTDQAASVQK